MEVEAVALGEEEEEPRIEEGRKFSRSFSTPTHREVTGDAEKTEADGAFGELEYPAEKEAGFGETEYNGGWDEVVEDDMGGDVANVGENSRVGEEEEEGREKGLILTAEEERGRAMGRGSERGMDRCSCLVMRSRWTSISRALRSCASDICLRDIRILKEK